MSFKRLDPQDFLISADSIVGGAWTGGGATLTNFNKSSAQEASDSGNYYLSVYQSPSTDADSEVQFNIAFGDSAGSGSLLFDSNIEGKSPTSAIFGQFQNIVLGDENANFVFGGTTPVTQSIHAITIDRARFKGNLFPGTMTLTLGSGSGITGDVIKITDNSKVASSVSFNEAGRVFQLLSGSAGVISSNTITDDAGNTYEAGYTPSGSYGLFLPDIGTIILNTSALELPYPSGGLGFETNLASNTDGDNNTVLFDSLNDTEAQSFTLNSQEALTSDFVFIRARNNEFNYSSNPSFISGSTGTVVYDDFINAPQTFITTVGLYNDNNELLAVAKLSKPLKKDFTKEALIRVKLDF